MRTVRRSTVLFTLALALVLGAGTAVVGLQVGGGGAWGLLVGGIVLVAGLRPTWRRWRLARQPVPGAWRRWLEQHVPYYATLQAPARERFERDVQFFVAEHAFEGVDGVEVTDALRLSVAAGAALLLHGRPDWELPAGRSILFYPDRFDDNYYGGAYAEYDGMAHEQGPILLSARAVAESWAYPEDGSNVVLHELAHLFDFASEGPDGVPSLVAGGSEDPWQELVRDEMQRIRQRQSMLRDYGATAPSEFFAVAVEVFFERPGELRRRHRALFDALVAFFNFDPRFNGQGRAVQPQCG